MDVKLYALYVVTRDEFKKTKRVDLPVGKCLGHFDKKEEAFEVMNLLVCVWDAFAPEYATMPDIYIYDVERKRVIG